MRIEFYGTDIYNTPFDGWLTLFEDKALLYYDYGNLTCGPDGCGGCCGYDTVEHILTLEKGQELFSLIKEGNLGDEIEVLSLNYKVES